jgi:hypothetical protein
VAFVPSAETEKKNLQPLRYVGLRLLKPQGVLFCPSDKLIGHATIIGNGNAGMKKGGAAAVPRHAYRAQTTVIMCGHAAATTDYSNSCGPRLSEPHSRLGHRAFTLKPSGKTNSAEQGAAECLLRGK